MVTLNCTNEVSVTVRAEDFSSGKSSRAGLFSGAELLLQVDWDQFTAFVEHELSVTEAVTRPVKAPEQDRGWELSLLGSTACFSFPSLTLRLGKQRCSLLYILGDLNENRMQDKTQIFRAYLFDPVKA